MCDLAQLNITFIVIEPYNNNCVMVRPHPRDRDSSHQQSQTVDWQSKPPQRKSNHTHNTPGSKSSRSRTSTKASRGMSAVSSARKQAPRNNIDVGGDHGSSGGDSTDLNEDPSEGGPPSQVAVPPTQTGADRWNHLDMTINESKRDKRTIALYVKDHFFSKCKFIRDPSEMEYSLEQQSICQTVCKGCNIPLERQQEWWQFAKKVVEHNLNKKRADVNSTMKRIFIGKPTIKTNARPADVD